MLVLGIACLLIGVMMLVVIPWLVMRRDDRPHWWVLNLIYGSYLPLAFGAVAVIVPFVD